MLGEVRRALGGLVLAGALLAPGAGADGPEAQPEPESREVIVRRVLDSSTELLKNTIVDGAGIGSWQPGSPGCLSLRR